MVTKLTAIVEQTGETLVLYDGKQTDVYGKQFQNLDRLEALIGDDDDFDEVLRGLEEGEWWRYAKANLTIHFEYERDDRYRLELPDMKPYGYYGTIADAKAQVEAWRRNDDTDVYAIRDMSNGLIAEEVF